MNTLSKTTQYESPASERRISAAAVRNLCGGISDMSLWRWLANPQLAFPKPIYIGRRRYWKESQIIDWLDAREVDYDNKQSEVSSVYGSSEGTKR